MRRLLLMLLLLSSPALAWYPSQLWQGDQAMRSDKPAEAEKFYRQALKERPDDARATYNLATSLYRQGQYKEAGELFHRLVEARDPEFVGRAAYNEGNALFQQKKNGEALEAYKVALRWNELDDDARYNIEQLLKQKNQQNKNDQNDKDKQNQDKDKDKDKDQKDKQDKNQDKNDQDKQDKNQDEDKNKDQDKDQNQNDQDKKDKDQSQKPQPQEPQMSKQDAERLLQYFQQKEDKDAPKARVRQARPPKGTETW